jgi:DNA-binding beta-propeller fold protein YncE
MIKISNSCLVAAFAVIALLGYLPVAEADIPGVTLAGTIDPSPGTDAYGLQVLQLNHATHKLYVAGFPSDSTRNFGLKVIDTTSNVIIGGIDLGRYTGSYNGFWPIGMDVDESAAPVGDKVYVIGRTDGSGNAILRVIDGPSNTNLTGENTDLFLPVGAGYVGGDFTSMAVNSSNHKIYVAKDNDEIVVVDGPTRQILRTLDPNFGDLVVANPVANKIFVVNHNGGGVINSADDTFAPLSLYFFATAAVLDSTHGRIYFVGRAQNGSNGIFAVDAATGALVGSKTGLAAFPLSVAVKPNENTLYVGSATDLLAFDAADFTPKGSFARPAVKLACDSTVSGGLYFLDDYRVSNQQNVVYAMNPATGVVANLAMGYRPFDIAINSRTNRIYVTDEQTNEILVIDGNNHAVVSRIPVIPPPSYSYLDRFQRHVAVSERLNRIYMPRTAEDPSTHRGLPFLDVFDGATNQFLRSIALDPTLYNADHVAVDDTRRQIYVTAARFIGTFDVEMMLLVYDADTEAPITTISLARTFGGTTSGLGANPVTGRVYASIGGVAIVDGNTNTKVGIVTSVGGPIAINRRTNKVYTRGDNSVAVINGATDSLETSFPIQNNNDFVVAFDVDEVTNRVYVAHAAQDTLTGRLTAYDADNSYQFLGQIDLGVKPVGIAFAAATRQLFVSSDLDGVISVLRDAAHAPADLFGNISTRAHVGDGDNVLIGGFIITGNVSKKVIIRAIGPSLTALGISGALSDPTLELHDSSGATVHNDDWQTTIISDFGSDQSGEIRDSGLAPLDPHESAMIVYLIPGPYTAVVRGKNGAAGVGLVEVYDLDLMLPAKLANISTRGHVDSGDNVMIAGVIVVGSKPMRVVLRAIGPSLASSGVPNPLEDPVLELRDPNGGLIASNDDWQEHEAEVNATLLAPTDPRESAIVASLYPANYTAIARGKNGATGVGLVEAYYLNQ